jgi:hypothetical protein
MGKLLIVLILVAAAFVGVAFYLNWFQFSTANDGNSTDYTVKVNKDKIAKDTEAAKEQGKKAWESAKDKSQDLLNRKTVRGTLADVNKDSGMIRVTTQDSAVPVRVTDKTVIERGGERITLNDLMPGQTVMVAYTMQEDQRMAESVTVETK